MARMYLFPVPQMLAMMVDLDDDDEWAMADELEDDDFDRYDSRPTRIHNWLLVSDFHVPWSVYISPKIAKELIAVLK